MCSMVKNTAYCNAPAPLAREQGEEESRFSSEPPSQHRCFGLVPTPTCGRRTTRSPVHLLCRLRAAFNLAGCLLQLPPSFRGSDVRGNVLEMCGCLTEEPIVACIHAADRSDSDKCDDEIQQPNQVGPPPFTQLGEAAIDALEKDFAVIFKPRRCFRFTFWVFNKPKLHAGHELRRGGGLRINFAHLGIVNGSRDLDPQAPVFHLHLRSIHHALGPRSNNI